MNFFKRFMLNVSHLWLRVFNFQKWLKTEQANLWLRENDKEMRDLGYAWMRRNVRLPLIVLIKRGWLTINKPVVLNTRDSDRYTHDITFCRDMQALAEFLDKRMDVAKMDLVEIYEYSSYIDLFLMEPRE